MKNLLKCNDSPFSAKIKGVQVRGKIRASRGNVYLCQDQTEGSTPIDGDMLGYKYAWIVGNGSERSLRVNRVTEFELFVESENFFNWTEGDVIIGFSVDPVTIAARIGDVVILNNDGKASAPYLCKELYDLGGRLFVERIPEEPEKEKVVMTIEEIAKLAGVDPKLLVISKKKSTKKSKVEIKSIIADPISSL